MQAMACAVLMESPCRNRICTYFSPILKCWYCVIFLNIDLYMFDKINLFAYLLTCQGSAAIHLFKISFRHSDSPSVAAHESKAIFTHSQHLDILC